MKLPEWNRFEPTVMSGQFAILDCRHKQSPSAVVIDVINTDKRGDRHVAPTQENANWSAVNALRELRRSVSRPNESGILIPYTVLNCLFALRCLSATPVVILAGDQIDQQAAINWLNRPVITIEAIIRAVLALGFVSDNKDWWDKSLATPRSWIWSADVPGMIIYVDCEQAEPTT